MANDRLTAAVCANKDVPDCKPALITSQKFFSTLLCICILSFVTACEAKQPMEITINLSAFSYIERPIFEITFESIDGKKTEILGGGGGGHGVMVGESVTLGPQKVTWRLDGPEGMAHNGETITAKNVPVLKDVPANARYLSLHIYPDNTVEFIFTEQLPEPTPRGEQELEKLRAKHHGE